MSFKEEVFKPLSPTPSAKLIQNQYVQNNITPEQKLLDALRSNLTLKETLRITTYSLATGDSVADGNPVQLLQGGSTPVTFTSTTTGADESIIEFTLPMLVKISSIVAGFELAAGGGTPNTYLAVDILNVNDANYTEVFKETITGAGNIRSVAIVNDSYTTKFRFRMRIDASTTIDLYPLSIFL